MAKNDSMNTWELSPIQITIAVGTYDGGIASYRIELYPDNPDKNEQDDDNNDDDNNDDNENVDLVQRRPPLANKLVIVFASPVHQGSVRSLTVAKCAVGATAGTKSTGNGGNSTGQLLLSTGYDETLKTHDFGKHLTSSGEVRTPADFGTPYCSAFAPPYSTSISISISSAASDDTASLDAQTRATITSGTSGSTHCLVGFGAAMVTTDDGATVSSTGGKLVIYKKRDWSIQHVLAGHDGGIASLAVHPTGKLALSGGQHDGKLKLWDLERGRLSFSSPTIRKSGTSGATTGSTATGSSKSSYESIDHIVWNTANGGDCYAFCHGSHVTVRHVQTGKDMLDVDLPSKVNQICLLDGPEGLFVAAACNDGSLPLLVVQLVDEGRGNRDTDERRAIMAIEPVEGPVAGEERFKCIQAVTGYYVVTANSAGVVSLMNLRGAVNMLMSPDTAIDNESDDDEDTSEVDSDDDDNDDNNETDFAVDIIDSVQLGSGARITCLTAWVSPLPAQECPADKSSKPVPIESTVKQRKSRHDTKTTHEVVLDETSLARARALVSKAKKIQKRKTEKKDKLAASKRLK